MTAFTESGVQQAAMALLKSLGWMIKHGLEIAPHGLFAERQGACEVVLERRLNDALSLLNPNLPAEALQDAFHRLTHSQGANLILRNADTALTFIHLCRE